MITESAIKKMIDDRISNLKRYRYKNATLTYTTDGVAHDRYGQELKTGDKVDVCRAAPGGLVTGEVAIILTINYSDYDYEVSKYNWETNKYNRVMQHVSSGSFTDIYIYTLGKRWTVKSEEEIIKIPVTK